ncbi:MAG: Asp23/Gls24 family envelope stress response protein [Microbacteriaceae bacterium]|nr:Asp23/Gls24 family envelope stress response protein [Microbacteriaceae bacterium]
MVETVSAKPTKPATATTAANKPATKPAETSVKGETVIEDGVVAKVIGNAVREVPGVHDLGGNVARAAGAIRGIVGNIDRTQGVSVEVGETEVAADIVIVANYPVPLQELSDEVRQTAADVITELVGLKVAEINVNINDVHFPGENEEEEEAPKKTTVKKTTVK